MNSNLSLPIILVTIFYGCANRQASEPVATSINTNHARPTPVSIVATSAPSPSAREEVTLQNGLRITPRNVKMENKDWRYQIDVDYPQIEGTNDRAIVILNRQIKDLVTKTYSWPLKRPTKKDLTYYAKWPDVYNSVDMEYDVVLANDELLSIYFMGYHYGIGAAHSVHASFTVNYHLKSHRLLKLTELFKPGAKYLSLISERCISEVSKTNPYLEMGSSWREPLTPNRKNFQSWNITSNGLRFNFDACTVAACAAGDLSVEIPFAEFKGLVTSEGLLNRSGGV